MVTTASEGPGSLRATRTELHRIAAHVIARRRAVVTGRFGLRVTPGGFGTPWFGDEEVVRISATTLVRERRIEDRLVSAMIDVNGVSMRDLGAFVDLDVDGAFSVGHDTPGAGDMDAPLAIRVPDAALIADWYAFGARALDRAVRAAGDDAGATVAQLWPEHFDVGLDLAAGSTRANLGASPGDDWLPEPYLYVGPWTADRPGNPAYWNASFGATCTRDEITSDADADAFFARGLAYLRGTP